MSSVIVEARESLVDRNAPPLPPITLCLVEARESLVDRNRYAHYRERYTALSRLARASWIEILIRIRYSSFVTVEARESLVDRNFQK